MAFMGLNPEKARTLSSAMRLTGTAAGDLSSEVTAALTLSQLESDIPGRLVASGEDLEQIGLIIAARADIAEGFVIDPATLAADVGITVAQAEAAIAAFADPDAKPAKLTPLLDAVAANRQAAEVLRNTFANLPSAGTDIGIDRALIRLGSWLPATLAGGELPVLTEEQVLDLRTLTDGLELDSGAVLADLDVAPVAPGDPETVDVAALTSRAGEPLTAGGLEAVGRALFTKVAEAFELDGRLAAAAGLPAVEDLYIQYQIDIDNFNTPFDTRFEALDEWLPAYLAGDIGDPILSDDPTQRTLLFELARVVGYQGSALARDVAEFEALSVADQQAELGNSLRFLRGGRFLQKSLIPGDFEVLDGPVIVWTENGVETALLAGRRQGVITDQTESVATVIAEHVLVDGDGSDLAIELSEEQQQALVAAVIAQNGQEFVLDNPGIQRQIVAAINLVGQQTTLTEQRVAFANAIEAFRSLAVVGSPAVTWSQLKAAVGDAVVDELGHTRLTGRSAAATNKRPQFISLVNHWGIPGEDTIKLKKRKFSFRFDENGELARVRNKKLSKWKRFKNSVKAFGKALWSEWTDNPWKYLFMGHAGLLPGANQVAEGVEDGDFDDIAEGSYEMAKFSAAIAATIFPATTAAGVAAMAVLVADTVYQASQGDWLGALGSAFSAVGGAAGYIGDVAAVGSAANIVSRGAAVAEGVVTAIDVGDDFVDALEDGDIFGALGSGFALAGSAASVAANGSELANSIGQNLSGNPILNQGALQAVAGADSLVNQQLLEQTFTNPVVSSGTIDFIGEVGQTAADLGAVAAGVEATLGAIENDDIAQAITGGFATIGRGAVAVGSPRGAIGNIFAPSTAGTIVEVGTSATQLAQIASQADRTITAIEQDDLQAAVVGGIATLGSSIDAATDRRGIIDDGLGLSPEVAQRIRAGGVSVSDLGAVADQTFATINAAESGDLAAALSNGFAAGGTAARLAANERGLVADLAGFRPGTVQGLNRFADETSVQLSEVAQVGGSLAAGDGLGALENAVDLARVGLDPESRLSAQLNVADEALDIGRYVEGVYDGRRGLDLETILIELGAVGAAVADIPAADPVVEVPGGVGGPGAGNSLAAGLGGVGGSSQTRGPGVVGGVDRQRLSAGQSVTTGDFLVETDGQNGGNRNEVVLLIGGGGESWLSAPVGDGLQPALRNQKLQSADIGYIYHDYGDNGAEWLRQYKTENPEAKVTIVGHSWGGDTAMNVAASLEKDKIDVDVITLDPVSMTQPARPGNVQTWKNVYVKGIDEIDDVVALVGGHWGQTAADVDLELSEANQNRPAGVSHEDATFLFDALGAAGTQPTRAPTPPTPQTQNGTGVGTAALGFAGLQEFVLPSSAVPTDFGSLPVGSPAPAAGLSPEVENAIVDLARAEELAAIDARPVGPAPAPASSGSDGLPFDLGINGEVRLTGTSANGGVSTGSFFGGGRQQSGDKTITEISSGSITTGELGDVASIEIKDGDALRTVTGDNTLRTEEVDFVEVKGGVQANTPLGTAQDLLGTAGRTNFAVGAELTGRQAQVRITEETTNSDGSISTGQGTGTESSLEAQVVAGAEAEIDLGATSLAVDGTIGGGFKFDGNRTEMQIRNDANPDVVEMVTEENEVVSLTANFGAGVANRPIEGAIGNGSSVNVDVNAALPIDSTHSFSNVTLDGTDPLEVELGERRAGIVDNSASTTRAEFSNGQVRKVSKLDEDVGLFSNAQEKLQAELDANGTVRSGSRVQDPGGVFSDSINVVDFERDEFGNLKQSLEVDLDDGWIFDTTTVTEKVRLDDGSLQTTTTTSSEGPFGGITEDVEVEVEDATPLNGLEVDAGDDFELPDFDAGNDFELPDFDAGNDFELPDFDAGDFEPPDFEPPDFDLDSDLPFGF